MKKLASFKAVALLALTILAGAVLSSCCAVCPMHRAKSAPGAGCPMPRGAFIESLDNFQKYFQGGAWDVAYKALQGVNAETPDGTTQLQGDDIRLLVTSGTTNPLDKAVVESHRDFIDIQMVIQGVDRFRWWPVPTLKLRTPYDPVKDILFYEVPAAAFGELTARPGTFAVFTPFDAHATVLHDPAAGGTPQPIRKAVVKIRASLVCPKM